MEVGAGPTSDYYVPLLIGLVMTRMADLGSTWVATPRLELEANPVARYLGWKAGIGVNLILCLVLPFWPLPAVMLMTCSALVGARNFQSAWLMRSYGESRYRLWMFERFQETDGRLFIACLFFQSGLLAAVGAVLMAFSGRLLVPFAMGAGILVYACVILFFTLLSMRRRQIVPRVSK